VVNNHKPFSNIRLLSILFLCARLGEPFNYCAILDDYVVDRVLGEGGFGTVNLAVNRETKKAVAIKFMDITQARKLHANILLSLIC
jgi:serine/threonine protein kinase